MAVGIRRAARALAEGNVGASAQPPYDRLAPWDAAIRFESTLMTAERILGAYPAIRWLTGWRRAGSTGRAWSGGWAC
jgi:hypothetical protein